MDRTLYVDLRCLQDHEYRVRGIGHHITALLRAREQSVFSRWKTVGLVDPRSPKLPRQCAVLVDEITSSINPCFNGTPSVFLDGTPMTHEARFSARFVGNPAFLCAAVVYDFIPLDWPGYLPTVAHRIDYLAKMAKLRKFDLFLPISEYTAWRLRELLGVSRHRIRITGASVRRSLYELRSRAVVRARPSYTKESYFVTVVAADPRKNPEVAVKAVRRLNLLHSQRIALKVVGHYKQEFRSRLLQCAGHAEGAGFLEFYSEIPDEDLAELYAGAIATIAPSHIEGFSLPVVEASLFSCPVVASTCAAQLELIHDREALFPSYDDIALSERLEALLNNPLLRDALTRSQKHLSEEFREDAVGHRFWNSLETAFEDRGRVPMVAQPRKAKLLAFLSPYPPDRCDAAFYTAMMLRAGRKLFVSHLYTDTERQFIVEDDLNLIGKIGLAPFLETNYNGVISILGSARSHGKIFELFERYGGPCILHDLRLTSAYVERLGAQGFLDFAAKLLGWSVTSEDVSKWIQDTDSPPPFLGRLLERASPLIVHTKTHQRLLKDHYGLNAHLAPCCPSVFFTDEEPTTESRRSARERLEIPPTSFAVASFGPASRPNGMDTCILAIDFLRSWNIPAELYFVGDTKSERAEIQRISQIYGVAEHVHCAARFEDAAAYKELLLASDASIQLRTFGLGAQSTLLSDCISAGLPSVTTVDMAASCDAPAYTATVPDHFSPLHVAEQLAVLWESKTDRSINEEARVAYLQTHNFDYYAGRLVEILELV